MADLSYIQRTDEVKIVGQDATGVAQNQVGADANGNMLVVDFADGPVAPGIAASKSILIGAQFNSTLPTLTNGQQASIQIESTGRLIEAPLLDTVGTTAALNALNATASIVAQGLPGVGVQIAAGTLIGTVIPEISLDGGTTWVATFFYDPTTSNIAASVVFASANGATTKAILTVGGTSNVRVRVSAYTSGSANATLRATVQASPFPSINTTSGLPTSDVHVIDSNGVSITTLDGNSPVGTGGLMIEGFDTTNSKAHRLAVDSLGRVITAPQGSNVTNGIVFGDVTLAAAGVQARVERTTYTEPTAQAQRSISSSSASDTLAGTGAQKVEIIYYDNTGAGPFTEMVNLNGTTAVPTTNTNIRFIESIEVTQVGSGGVNAGTITLFVNNAGGGGTIGTIGVGDRQTFWAHHYTPTGKTTNITSLSANNNSTAIGNGGVFVIRALAIGVTGAPEEQVSDFIRLFGQSSNITRSYGTPIQITGPARITIFVTPDSNVSIVQRAGFDFFDQ